MTDCSSSRHPDSTTSLQNCPYFLDALNKMSLSVNITSGPSTLKLREAHVSFLKRSDLPECSMSLLGTAEDVAFEEAHSLPAKLDGRSALVYFTEEPSEYFVQREYSHHTRCILRPVISSSRGNGPAILIDPRCLPSPLQQLPVIKLGDDPLARVHSGGGGMKTQSSNQDRNTDADFKDIVRKEGDGEDEKGDGEDKKRGNPTGKGSRGSYFSYDAPFANAPDIFVPLPQMPIGAVEFLTYFPHHTKWTTVMLRLFRNGWNISTMAKVMLHARGALNQGDFARRKATLRHQLRTAVTNVYGIGAGTPAQLRRNSHPEFVEFIDHSSGNNLDLYDTRLQVQTSGHVYQPPRGQSARDQAALIQHIVTGVVNHPTGRDRGPLTRAIQWAMDNGELARNTDYLPTIVRDQSLGVPAQASTCNWDTGAQTRLTRVIADP